MTTTPLPPTTTVPLPNDAAMVLVNTFESNLAKLEKGDVRAALETSGLKVWDAEEFKRDFDILHHTRPYAFATKKQTGAPGTAIFIDVAGGFYLDFKPLPPATL